MKILIKNSSVIDGTGTPPKRLDILIENDYISAVGLFPDQPADVKIDGTGMVTTPGYIDVHSSADHYLTIFSKPIQERSLLQGVTTIIGGHGGSSLAPIPSADLNTIRKWADTDQINVDWRSLSELFSNIQKAQPAINFGTLVGHGTVRRSILGESPRDLTEDEFESMQKILEEALVQGALGISFGLQYNQAHHTPYKEIKDLLQSLKKNGGVFVCDLRDPQEKLEASIEEVVHLAQEAGVKTVVNNFLPKKKQLKEHKEAREKIEQLGLKSDVRFSMNPFNYIILPIYLLLPAIFREGSLEHMLQALHKQHTIEEIKLGLPQLKGEDIIIARAPDMDYLVGKSLKTFADNKKLGIKDALLELMKLSKMRAVVLYKDIDEKANIEQLGSDFSMIGSQSASSLDPNNHFKNQTAEATFSRFVSLREEYKRSLEWAIHKITGEAARMFSISNRGTIAVGKKADIIMHRDNQLVHVLVNGQLAVVKGEINKKVRAGQIVKRT